MEREGPRPRPHSRRERARRLIIWFFIIAVPWAPDGVALAMILTGNLGR
jgi:hypothetical protein